MTTSFSIISLTGNLMLPPNPANCTPTHTHIQANTHVHVSGDVGVIQGCVVFVCSWVSLKPVQDYYTIVRVGVLEACQKTS